MNYLKLGSITGFWGVKGWVKLYSLTRPKENIKNYTQFYLGVQKKPVVFKEIKQHGKYIVGMIDGVTSRELAAPFLGQELYIDQSDLPKEDNAYYWVDLIGTTVRTKAGEPLGVVDYLIETGANDVLVIKSEDNKEYLVPFVLDHFVVSIDLDKKEIVVDWELDDAL